MTLRGVNLNSLGDYYQDDPHLPPVVPVTGADWDAMAAHGFNVVRLLVSWSALEPRPGTIDGAYLALIRRTVRDAARRGIYSVIDMHQDAWGKYIASPRGVACPAGHEPGDRLGRRAAVGDDHRRREHVHARHRARTARPCSPRGTASTPTATASRPTSSQVWGALGRAFAREPAVAGFDLLNEPNHGHRHRLRRAPRHATSPGRSTRSAPASAPATASRIPVFFETTVFGVPVPVGFTTDRNVVFEGHNYGESIGDLPIEGVFDYFQALATQYDAPLWIGEYGWFSDPPAQRSKLVRYSAKEDALLTAGDAWWQWRQACGDPHSIGHPGGTPDAVLVHFQRNGCPGDHNLGVVPEWSCTWRAYPRAVAGPAPVRRRACATARSSSPRRPAARHRRGLVPRPGATDGHRHRTSVRSSATRGPGRLDRAVHRHRDVLGARRGLTVTPVGRVVAAHARRDPDGVAFAGAGALHLARVLDASADALAADASRRGFPSGAPASRCSCPTAATCTCCTSPPSGPGSSSSASDRVPAPREVDHLVDRTGAARAAAPSCPNRAIRRRSTRPARSGPTSCGS